MRIRHFRALCRDANDGSATVFVRAVLDTDRRRRTVELVTTLIPVDDGRSEHRRGSSTASRRWQPARTASSGPSPSPTRASGGPTPSATRPATTSGSRCTAAGRLVDELLSDERSRRIGLRRSIELRRLDRLTSTASGCSSRARTRARHAWRWPRRPPTDFARDVALAKDANLDFLRVHAHVSRPELYDAADEAGLLLWQDMPLQWGYHRSVRQQARRQARELVDLLGHHPIVFVWCGHNEPMAVDIEPDAMIDRRRGAGKVVRPAPSPPRCCRRGTRACSTTRSAGCSRPPTGPARWSPTPGVFPHPPQFDGTDTHPTSAGTTATERRLRQRRCAAWPRLARFVTEFGAQAVPEDAVVPRTRAVARPRLGSRAYRDHALQKPFMDRYVAAGRPRHVRRVARRHPGATRPRSIRHHVETLRRLKYRPSGGFAQFNFADGFPSVTWSVLGHDRAPKLGYEALAAACAPVLVVTDPLPAAARTRATASSLDVHVVNDLHIALDDMMVTCLSLVGEDGEVRPTSTARGDGRVAYPPTRASGSVTLDLLVPAATGPLVLELELAPGRPRPARRPASARGAASSSAPAGRPDRTSPWP